MRKASARSSGAAGSWVSAASSTGLTRRATRIGVIGTRPPLWALFSQHLDPDSAIIRPLGWERSFPSSEVRSGSKLEQDHPEELFMSPRRQRAFISLTLVTLTIAA